MTDSESPVVLEVPARAIPVPTSVSPEAQAYLARGPLQTPENPPIDDIEGWRNRIAAIDEMMLRRQTGLGNASPDGFQVAEVALDGAKVYTITPPSLEPEDHRVYLDAHGGAFIVGGGELCRAQGIRTADRFRMRVRRLPDAARPSIPSSSG